MEKRLDFERILTVDEVLMQDFVPDTKWAEEFTKFVTEDAERVEENEDIFE